MDLSKERNVIQTIWVFDLKHKGSGKLSGHKARLVVKGFSQIPEIDFLGVFSPVYRYASVRFVMALSVKCGWKVWKAEVNNGFVNAPIFEEIYIASHRDSRLSDTNIWCID